VFASAGVGIDVGTHTIKMAWVRRGVRGGALLRCVAIERDRLHDGAEDDQFAAGLKANLMGLGLKVRRAVVGLSGRDMIFRLARLPASAMGSLEQLTAHEAEQLGGGADVCHDFRLVNLPSQRLNELSALLAVAKRPVVQSRLESLAAAGVHASFVCPAALALLNAYRMTHPPSDETVLLLDIGESATEAVVARNGLMIFARGLSPAGRDFTDAIRQSLAISASKAEQVKRRDAILSAAGRAGDRRGGPDLGEALAAVAQQLANSVQSTLQHCRSQAKLPTLQPGRILLSGGGAQLRGLAEYLSAELRAPVQPLDPFASLKLPRRARDAGLTALPTPFATAIGLACSAVAGGPLLDLMPRELRSRREFATRGVFSVAAAVALVAASTVLTVGAYHDLSVQRAMHKLYAEKQSQAQTRRQQLDKLSGQNRRLARSIELVASAPRPALALFDCLDAIRRAMPSPVRLTSISEKTGNFPPPDTEGLPAPPVIVVASGLVKGADIQLSEVLKRFVAQLESDPRIALVKSLPPEPGKPRAGRDDAEGRALTFSLEIHPRPPEEQEAPRSLSAGEDQGRSGPGDLSALGPNNGR